VDAIDQAAQRQRKRKRERDPHVNPNKASDSCQKSPKGKTDSSFDASVSGLHVQHFMITRTVVELGVCKVFQH